MDIGIKIKKIRTLENLTLQELADKCGCSKSMLSKIENSAANPSIATLSKIAKALKIKMSILLDDEGTQTCVFTPAESLSSDAFIKSEYGYIFAPLATNYLDSSMTPLLTRGKAGEVTEHHLSHNGEEFIMMLKGEMLFQVGETEYHMKERDCIYFSSLEKHGMKPLTEDIEYLDIVI